MRKITYKVSKGEDFGTVPDGSLVTCYIVYEDPDTDSVLVYFPKKIEYIDLNGDLMVEFGCGSLSLAQRDNFNNYHIKSKDCYINLRNKDSKVFESMISISKKTFNYEKNT